MKAVILMYNDDLAFAKDQLANDFKHHHNQLVVDPDDLHGISNVTLSQFDDVDIVNTIKSIYDFCFIEFAFARKEKQMMEKIVNCIMPRDYDKTNQ